MERENNHQVSEKKECFLCTLDQKYSCHTPRLEGFLLNAQEIKQDGEWLAVLLLDTGISHVEIVLESHYYRSLIREIKARGSEVMKRHRIKIHIYHLPTESIEAEYRGRKRLRYRGNSYTMAVLEPDILLNITDLNQSEYCSRQYMLNRMLPSGSSPATIRGNLVHHSFKEMLKAYDRGRQSSPTFDAVDTPTTADDVSPLHIMQNHLEQALELNNIEMAMVGVTPDAMRDEAMPHLESLARWFESERNTLWALPGFAADDQDGPGEDPATDNQVRAETFLLAPEIGLRGRLDLFWRQSGQQRLLELKTGGSSGELPKRDHKWQVYGYHALLAARRDAKMKKALATLVYSGTPGHAQAFGIPATIREIQRVNERRNILVLSHVTTIPAAPPGPSRCLKCAMQEQCQTVSTLLNWQPPELERQPAHEPQGDEPREKETRKSHSLHTPGQPTITPADKEFFSRYYDLLAKEGRAVEQQALFWTHSVEERIESGSAITELQLQGNPKVERDGWVMTFDCHNTSELREGDEILLSSGDPVTGEVVSGTIMRISSEQVIVWTRELISHPRLIDRYETDLVHVRTLQNLLRWQHVPSHLRDLVAGRIRPHFKEEPPVQRTDFNSEQNLAVTRALQMQDYLLIQGPPGTGKTSVIAEIVKQLTARGQRVLLAAFTNQAVDNMLKRLDREGFHDYLRLGSERSVDDAIKPRLLKGLVERTLCNPAQPVVPAEMQQVRTDQACSDIVHDILQKMPVVASTTATWSSDKYTPRSVQHENDLLDNKGFAFDIAIIDEAGQLTIPAILGALRFARRFILVGDEKQLPPLVLSPEAAESGLSDSLFSFLKKLDEDYILQHPLAVNACVPLRVQYRMNKWISNFSSRVFYEQQLHAHESIADRRLEYTRSPLAQAGQKAEHEGMKRTLDPRHPLVFLDVHGSQSVINVDAKQSNAEAQAVREIVAGLLARGIKQEDIGIIAPYRAQVANIRRYLFSDNQDSAWQALPANTPLSVDTVDRFQGGERPVIIISFATTVEPQPESPRRGFLINPNRLNVALTRAQRKLILVGCVPALENLPHFSRLIAYCRSMKTLFPHSEPALL